MDPRWEIRQQLRVLRDAWPPEQSERFGLAYRGPADFVLRHGRWWKPILAPAGMTRGIPRACFGNSIGAAVAYELRYVEGWALDPGSARLAVPHAWNADRAGNCIDLTWDPVPGRAYLGVEFSVERADDATWNGDANVLDDFIRDWPLLREPWKGERAEPDPAWSPSPSLLALRAALAGDFDERDRLMERACSEAEASS